MASQNETPALSLTCSRSCPSWLEGLGAGLAFTTYQAGKLFLVGLKEDRSLAIFERTFPRCMGLAVSGDGRSLALATEFQILRFDNVLPPGEEDGSGHDSVFAPHAGWITGDVDAHDVAFGADGRPVFANTLFSCLATVSDGHSFQPLWKPEFISRLAAEDRCHLNGMAMAEGQPAFVTSVAACDVADGWRDRRRDGGIVIDVASGETVATGLSMPHSPRLHDGRLWLLNSGKGELGFIEPGSGRFEPVAFCPGYARGLAIAGRHALVGLSLAREHGTFAGLGLEQALAERNADARCGLAVFDLEGGDMIAWVRIEGVVRELYDVAILPGTRRPSAIGFKTDEIKRVISIEE
jgi:uncharacterized protein (TIGR03032 family)